MASERALLAEWLGEAGDSAESLLSSAARRYKAGDLDGAGRDAAQYRREHPASAAGHAVQALLAAAAGDAAAAKASADAAVAGTGEAWARALRGTLRGRWGDLDGARADLDAALKDEQAPWALAARADALNGLGFFWLALEDLDRLAAQLPGDAEPHGRAALIHKDQAQYADAHRRLKRAESLDPANPRWPRLRAEVHFVQGDAAAAAEQLSRALRLAPEDGSLHFERVRALALAGRAQEAEAALKAAPVDPASRAHLTGYLLARRRRWKKASACFRKAAALSSGGLTERARLYAWVTAELAAAKPVKRIAERELRLMGLGYRQPFQVSTGALASLMGAEVIFSNLSDASVVDFVGLFGVPFQAIVFRRSDEDAFKAAADVMPGFKKHRVVGVVTRGHPLYYGRLAYRLSRLTARRGWPTRVPASASLSDSFLSMSDPGGSAHGAQLRDCNDLGDIDPRLPLVLYNFGATGDWRAELPKKLMRFYPASHPVYLLAGSGDREFSPQPSTLGEVEAPLRLADEAVTLLLPGLRA